jgi:hypothetical protein
MTGPVRDAPEINDNLRAQLCSPTGPTNALILRQLVPGKTFQEAPFRLGQPYTLFMPH